MRKTLNSDGMTVDISSNQNQSTPLGKTETSGTLRHPLDKLQKFLKGNLKALGVAQIMIGVKCIFYGITGFLLLDSEMYRIIFFSIYTGFPIWGALSLRGNLGANTLSTFISIVGICILLYNLTKNIHHDCKKETLCLGIKSIATGLVIVLMILTCLQILISLPLSMLSYNVDDENIHWICVLLCWKSPSEGLYQDLLPQTIIYRELERKEDTPSCYPTDTNKQI
uniref:membrane-spanning 4-domains subfamily A member 3-like isoform X2 n=1 Tax=Nyctereutes procyonoides TaxID=34880 RepID=UPI0024444E7C|nr:membrane-spanning 4-domains subfamily A member 3-like isoform X2 [Nyctereutes procyonoides]